MAYIFITRKEKTNWKYILIIVILALIVIGETLYLLKQEEKISEIKFPEKVVRDETLNWKTYRFAVEDFEEMQGITEEVRNEIKQKIKEREIKNCSFEIKYPPDWTAYTWPLHGVIVPEGLFIEEDPETHKGCSFQMSFYGNPEKEKYCFPTSFSSGESNLKKCNKIFNQMLSTFRFLK